MGDINILAVLLAAMSAFLLGGIWYGPLFGKAWRKEVGLTIEDERAANQIKKFGLSFAFSLLSAVMLAHLFARVGVSKPHIYMMISTGIALGFIIPSIGITYLFGHKSGKLFAIDSGYWIGFYAAMGGVFALLGA
jgi:hypothetical protein